MAFFNFKNSAFFSPTPVRSVEKVTTTHLLDSGEVVTSVDYMDVDPCSDDYIKNLPTFEEYQLDKLLSAGVPLEQINTSNFLNSSDPATLERLTNYIGNRAISSFNSDSSDSSVNNDFNK